MVGAVYSTGRRRDGLGPASPSRRRPAGRGNLAAGGPCAAADTVGVPGVVGGGLVLRHRASWVGEERHHVGRTACNWYDD